MTNFQYELRRLFLAPARIADGLEHLVQATERQHREQLAVWSAEHDEQMAAQFGTWDDDEPEESE